METKLEQISIKAGEATGALVADLADSATDYVKTGREYVQENPIKGVAMAAAVGLIAGSLLTMALRKNNKLQ